ncbi:RteC domain-containing protein [Schleiferiaceae bacterium]|nr:RteC domain-containing protein [Schleiferiaceae bacterium]MDC1537963.1 RteC domain-containing protein [Schleiferiaceae bacterium]
MVNSLELILEEISKAEVKLGRNTGRVALNLFEYQEVVELSFNGHSSLVDYDHHCESLLQGLKDQIDSRLSEVASREVVVQDIELLMHEVISQEKRYFPKRSPEDWYLKLHFKIKHQKEKISEDIVQQSILRYLNLQKRLLERTKELLKHRTALLRSNTTLLNPQPEQSNNTLPVAPNGQVELFHENPGFSPLVWNRTSSDLLELVIALHRSNSISLSTGPIHQKDLIAIFSRFLNKELKFSNQVISALKRRKKPETSYTLELHQQYRFYCDDV